MQHGENRGKTRKVGKNHIHFTKTVGNLENRGKRSFSKIGGWGFLLRSEIGEKVTNFESMPKKKSILMDKHRIVLGKGQIGEKFTDSERCSEIGGNLKLGGMHHCLCGDGRPWLLLVYDKPNGSLL